MGLVRAKKEQKNKQRCGIKQRFVAVCAAQASSDFSHARAEESRGNRRLSVGLSGLFSRP